MSDDESSSQDDDYQPTKKEIKEAEGEERKSKRRKSAQAGNDSIPQGGKGSANVEALWQQLKAPSSRATALGSLHLASPAQGKSSSGVAAGDREWMRQLGVVPKSGASIREAASKGKAETAERAPGQKVDRASTPVHAASKLGISAGTSHAAAALAAAKIAMSNANAQASGQVSVLETRRFAGKDIQVRKLATSEEAEQLERKEKERKRAGIDAVLASLESAKKVNVLDKSRDDWGNFKSEDTQIADELEAYKKSGGKYLDKVDFLKRAELREYEAERDKRLAGDGKSRGKP